MNTIGIDGHLTADPEIIKVGEHFLTKIRIASNRTYRKGDEKKQETCFIDCQAWDKLAETIKRFCEKGKRVLITGRLKYESWEDREGAKKSRHVIEIKEIDFIGKPKERDNNDPAENQESELPI